MSQWMKIEPTRHQVAIAGRVTDSQTGQAIAGAQVNIKVAPAEFVDRCELLKNVQYSDHWESMPERPDQKHTASDGHFHFMDLPDGDYTLEATLPRMGTRYGMSHVTVIVSRDGQDINMAQADMTLFPTGLQGQVMAGTDPVMLAEVRMKGSGEYTFTDEQGNYLLVGLEAGIDRTVIVSARNFTSIQSTKDFVAGEITSGNFNLH